MRIRSLRPQEREAVLALLDGWELPDGWRGRDFFRRYLELDPTFREENLLVAERDGALVSCVQIFPRRIGVRGVPALLGGIGSVYTRPDARGSGVASALLERAQAEMRARGMLLSLLFTGRLDFYGRLGWRSWKVRRALLSREPRARPQAETDAGIALFDAGRDLGDVAALHREFSGALPGAALRDTREWQASLRLTGNPDEEFLVARSARAAGRLRAYVRGIRLQGVLLVAELAAGAEPGDAEALAALLVALLRPRDPDPLAPPDKSSEEFRRLLVLPLRPEPPLAAALRRAGVELHPVEDPTVMLRCLDLPALARTVGEEPHRGEDEAAYLARLLPPERFGYWPADRF